MNGKKYTSFIATALIAFVALFGTVPQQTFAQTAPFVPTFHTGSTWCGGCVAFKGTPNGKIVDGLVGGGKMQYNNIPTQRDFPDYLADRGQTVPVLEHAPGQFINPKQPGFAEKLAEIGKEVPKQQEEKICIVPRPGQSEKYGPITDNPAIYQPLYPIQDTSATHPVIAGHIADEADINFKLRKLGSKKMTEHIAELQKQPREGATKKFIDPNYQQTDEYIQSMGGNPNTQGSYKIDGTDVPVGEYRANQQDQRTGITFDENCENPKKTGPAPAPDPGKNPGGAAPGFGGLGGNPGGGGNGGGGGFGGGGGGLGGGAGGALGQLLPLLMQGLMGGGQQGQGQGQNQYGAGYGNQQSCDAQAVAPVCGMDGKTYNNSCYLNQQGVILRNTGVCTQTNPSVSPAPSINSVVTLTQLAQSGIPSTLLDNVRNLVTSVMSTILAGTKPTETTVK